MNDLLKKRISSLPDLPQDEKASSADIAGIPNSTMESIARGTLAPTSAMLGHRENLSPSLQTKMQGAFGADFSNVEIYRSETARNAGFKGIASGNKVALAPDIDLNSHVGQSVLGHELSHVVAQAQGIGGGSGFLGNSSLERQADIQGERAASGMRAIAGSGLAETTSLDFSAPTMTMGGAEAAGLTPISPTTGAFGVGAPMQGKKGWSPSREEVAPVPRTPVTEPAPEDEMTAQLSSPINVSGDYADSDPDAQRKAMRSQIEGVVSQTEAARNAKRGQVIKSLRGKKLSAADMNFLADFGPEYQMDETGGIAAADAGSSVNAEYWDAVKAMENPNPIFRASMMRKAMMKMNSVIPQPGEVSDENVSSNFKQLYEHASGLNSFKNMLQTNMGFFSTSNKDERDAYTRLTRAAPLYQRVLTDKLSDMGLGTIPGMPGHQYVKLQNRETHREELDDLLQEGIDNQLSEKFEDSMQQRLDMTSDEAYRIIAEEQRAQANIPSYRTDVIDKPTEEITRSEGRMTRATDFLSEQAARHSNGQSEGRALGTYIDESVPFTEIMGGRGLPGEYRVDSTSEANFRMKARRIDRFLAREALPQDLTVYRGVTNDTASHTLNGAFSKEDMAPDSTILDSEKFNDLSDEQLTEKFKGKQSTHEGFTSTTAFRPFATKFTGMRKQMQLAGAAIKGENMPETERNELSDALKEANEGAEGCHEIIIQLPKGSHGAFISHAAYNENNSYRASDCQEYLLRPAAKTEVERVEHIRDEDGEVERGRLRFYLKLVDEGGIEKTNIND